jgi:hypothetical protein
MRLLILLAFPSLQAWSRLGEASGRGADLLGDRPTEKAVALAETIVDGSGVLYVCVFFMLKRVGNTNGHED